MRNRFAFLGIISSSGTKKYRGVKKEMMVVIPEMDQNTGEGIRELPDEIGYERSCGGLGCRVKVLDTFVGCRGCSGSKGGDVASLETKGGKIFMLAGNVLTYDFDLGNVLTYDLTSGNVLTYDGLWDLDHEDMDQDSAHMVAASKVPMLNPKNRNSALRTTVVEGAEEVMPPTTAKEKAQKRLEDAKLLMEAVEKRFGGNAATKKTQRNLLKQQYENFTASSSEMLDQTFDRLQKLVSQLELLGETISQEDVNQKLLRSLSPEWNTHVVVWRNKTDLDTMSMDDL
ncbi:hypothetical protein Tco_0617281 [Tanacetum coccineum]